MKTSSVVKWLGHSTVMIQFPGMLIITDPILVKWIGQPGFGAFRYGKIPRLTKAEISNTDVILISHAHFDHMDISTIKRFDNTRTIIMTARGTSDVVAGLEFDTRELAWGKSVEFKNTTIKALRVNHLNWRYPTEIGTERTCNAYLISHDGYNIFFGGDMALPLRFRVPDIPVHLAILPIGSSLYNNNAHISAEQAIVVADTLHSKYILPMHWGTYSTTIEGREPIKQLFENINDPSRIVIKRIGQSWILKKK